jgi:DNA-binding NarL/FixJ family response regulator
VTTKPILLVADNPDDEALTLRAFKKSNISVVTSSKQEEDILGSHRSGANAYVRKPMKFSEFADAVQAVGVFWLLLNEPAPSRAPESN